MAVAKQHMSASPQRGELWWVEFDPREGHEQGGRRPALVISQGEYNRRTGLMLCLPVTRRAKGYSTELRLPAGLGISGSVLTSHVYTIDYRARQAEFGEAVPPDVVETAVDMLTVLIR